MIILFGSYAKNKYVDYDQRIEFGVPTYYMSDYDLLILTRKDIGAVKFSLYSKIKNRFFEDKNRPFHTHPQFINYGIDDFNYALSKAHYFETEIKRDGIVLYDSILRKLKSGHRIILRINLQQLSTFSMGSIIIMVMAVIKCHHFIFINQRRIYCVPFLWSISCTVLKTTIWTN